MLNSNMDPEIQSILREWGYENPYLVGQGAFASVYRVKECTTGCFYACKVSREQEMLRRENILLQQIEHPLFPAFHDFGQRGGFSFLFMEYIWGTNLGTLISRRGRMSERQAIRIGIQLAEGLCYLHERNTPILFRDVKPENIMICEDGRIRLLDLGSAGEISASMHVITGTPGFAAPEQWCESGKVGCYSDVYAVGKVLYYMLCGVKLHRGVEQLLENCIRKEKDARFPDMRCLLHRLQSYDTDRKGKILRLEINAYLCGKRSAEYVFQQNILKL